jgi:hypothetical protein
MSIGNLKDEGNKGNNFPWQLKMLQGLSAISSGINSLVGALTPTPNPAVPVAITVVPEAVTQDAGFRSRVSQLTTLGDLKSINRYRTDLWLQNSTGTGTVAWANNKFTLGVTAKDDSAIIQSKVSYPYFAGKSQLIECTFAEFEPITGVTKRVGYYDFFSSGNADGIWLESGPNDTVTLIFKSAFGGIDYEYPVASWINQDFVTHDWAQFNVVMFDFVWLGGLRLRLFASGPNGFTLAHEVDYAGQFGEGDTFISYPSHPVTYQLLAPSGPGGTFNFSPICAQVATEGAIDNAGIVRACGNGKTAVSLATIGTAYPLLAIRKAYANSPIKLVNFELSVASNTDRVYWEIQINPTLSAALTYNQIDSQSTTQFALGNGTITVTGAGRIIASGYLSTGQTVRSINFEDNFLSLLGGTNPSTALSATFTADTYVLVITPLTATVSTLASMQVKEL